MILSRGILGFHQTILIRVVQIVKFIVVNTVLIKMQDLIMETAFGLAMDMSLGIPATTIAQVNPNL